MLNGHEPSEVIVKPGCYYSDQQDYLLFSGAALPDALANLAALMQCLCEIQQEHYGVNLLQCMIRDTLLSLSKSAFGYAPPQSDESSA